MEILDFLKSYWTQIVFLFGILGAFIIFAKAMIDATKCSLRNDILTIFEALEHSADLYFKLKGNSFVKDVVNKVKNYEIVD